MAINTVNKLNPTEIPLPPSPVLSRANSFSSQTSSSAKSSSSKTSAETVATTVATTGAATPPKAGATTTAFTLPNGPNDSLSPAQVKLLAQQIQARSQKAKQKTPYKVLGFVLGAAGNVAQAFRGLANKLGAAIGACKQYVSGLFSKKVDTKKEVVPALVPATVAELEQGAAMVHCVQS